jgi:hypothetical protein
MLYFIYFTSRMHFIYHVLKTRETYIFLYFKHIFNYIKKRYSLKVKIFNKDKETIIRLGN